MEFKKLGGFEPPLPLQGIVLDRLVGNLYAGRATSVMSDFLPEKYSDSVECWSCETKDFEFIEQLSKAKILAFAKQNGGVAFTRPNCAGWIIKGIAPKMRRDYDCNR